MKRVLVLSIITVIAISSFAQADCVLAFSYTGEIKGDIKIDRIQLPTTAYLMGYTDSAGEFVSTLPGDSSLFRIKCRSHLSSDFCMSKEEIIEKVFKRVKSYPVKIFEQQKDHAGKNKIIELEIPLDQIKFIITESKELIVELPMIEIK